MSGQNVVLNNPFNLNQNQTPLQNQTNLQNRNKILSLFLSQYINQQLIEDIVNISIYNIDINTATSNKTADAMNLVKSFIRDCQKDLTTLKTLNLPYPINLLKSYLNFAYQVLDLRKSLGDKLITYENLETHFVNLDITLQKVIQNIKTNSINNLDQFRNIFDKVMQTVQLANELRGIRKTLIDWDILLEEADSGNVPLLNMANNYRELLITSYSELSNLKVINKVNDLSNYILISDERSIKTIAQNIVKYLATGYSFYKSGYSLIDTNIGGIESANVHIICGPSNNAKSIFMINLSWQMLLNNIQEFEEHDMFLFYTLEDDIYKLIRRFVSIFGNYDSAAVKTLFVKLSSILKKQKFSDFKNADPIVDEAVKIVQEMLRDAIYKVTGKRINFILTQGSRTGDQTTPGDIVKFIDAKRCEGMKAKALFIDYIDIMAPSNSKYTDYNDYNSHGMIVQELRNIAGEYGIPVITITQGTRESENVAVMSNSNMACFLGPFKSNFD